MLAAPPVRPPPPALLPPPRRVVSTIRLRNTLFGLHLPIGKDGVSEASVLAFTARPDAVDMAFKLIKHRTLTRQWPGRVLSEEGHFALADWSKDIRTPPEEMEGMLEMHALRICQEPFQALVRRLALEEISVRLVTDIDGDGGASMHTSIYRDRVDTAAKALHLKTLLALKSDKH